MWNSEAFWRTQKCEQADERDPDRSLSRFNSSRRFGDHPAPDGDLGEVIIVIGTFQGEEKANQLVPGCCMTVHEEAFE